MKKTLSEIQHSYCPAKWESISIDLSNAKVKSCHYPQARKINIKDLKKDIDSLHNSNWLKKQRSKMLSGIKPSECHYCWDLEDQGHSSPRLKWLKASKSLIVEPKHTLKRVEVSFSSNCNLACSYCNAEISSSIASEQKKFGPYFFEKKVLSNKSKTDYDAYFWKWFETQYSDLEQVRITGGEPLLGPYFKRLVNLIEEKPNPKLNLAINSNLSISKNLFHEAIRLLNRLVSNKKISSFTFFTSLDGWSNQASYIRSGLDLKLWQENMEYILENTYADIVITNTFSILSIESTSDFISNTHKYFDTGRVKLSLSKLQYPRFLALEYANVAIKEQFAKELRRLNEKSEYKSYVSDLSSLYEMTSSKSKGKYRFVARFWQHCLRLFLFEYDKRKKSSFKETFPQLNSLIPKFNINYYRLLIVFKFLNPNRLWP